MPMDGGRLHLCVVWIRDANLRLLMVGSQIEASGVRREMREGWGGRMINVEWSMWNGWDGRRG